MYDFDVQLLVFVACITLAQFDAKVKQWASDADARYVAALEKQKMRSITLPQVAWDTNGVGPAPTQREITRDGKRLLVAGPISAQCGIAPANAYLLAQKGDKIFLVDKRLQQKRVDVKVCVPKTCPKIAPDRGGCGAAPKPMMVAYELPANTTFGGEVTITIASQWASAEMVGTNNCPAVAPPPPRP